MRRSFLTMLAVWIAALVPGFGNAAVIRSAELDPLIQGAPLIVQGFVREQTPILSPNGSRILTVNRIEVRSSLKGEAPQVVEVVTRGGELNGLGQRVEGEAVMRPNEEVVLLLKSTLNNPGRFQVHGMALGKFSVVTAPDGKRMVVQDRSGLAVLMADGTTAAPSPFAPMAESAFLDRIRSFQKADQ